MLLLLRLQLFAAVLASLALAGGPEVYYRATMHSIARVTIPGKTVNLDQFTVDISYCYLPNEEIGTFGCLEPGAEFKKLKTAVEVGIRDSEFATKKLDPVVLSLSRNVSYPIPFHQLGFPVHTFLHKEYRWWHNKQRRDRNKHDTSLEIRFPTGGFIKDENKNSETDGSEADFNFIPYTDTSDVCEHVRQYTDHRRAKPHEDIDDAVTYINEIQAKKGWVFIKEKKDICYYSFEFNRLSSGFSWTFWSKTDSILDEFERFPAQSYKITTYKTDNYLLKFFAFDSLFGCFVSLYWNGTLGVNPEIHYYMFDEMNKGNDPQLVKSMVLKKFSMHILENARYKIFHSKHKPVMTSFGGQVFIYARDPGSDVGYFGHYINSTHQYNKTIRVEPDIVPLGYYKYVGITESVIASDKGSATPRPRPPPMPVTTPSPAPTRKPPGPSTVAPFTTTQEETPTPTSSDSDYDSTVEASSEQPDSPVDGGGQSHGGNSASEDDSGGECSFLENCLGCFIGILVLDVFLIIILIVLVMISRRGAKKMKAAMAKGGGSKSKFKSGVKSKTELKNLQHTIAGKKSETETAAAARDADGNDVSKDQNVTDDKTKDQTKFYTVNDTFEKSEKSKNSKK